MSFSTGASAQEESPAELVDQAQEALLELMAPKKNRALFRRMLKTIQQLNDDDVETLDLKITAAAISEMRDAYAMFRPYHDRQKVTVFGSARTAEHDPLYRQTEEVARRLSRAGWMVVTGAGPGIMEAGMRGAGRESSIGVSIRLPNEQQANPVIQDDPKHVTMRYFFTRKLMLVKESHGFICMPGGFGTLDETFELLTLTQTGKGIPVPIVLLDVPGDRYWSEVEDFIRDQLLSRGLVSDADMNLFTCTNRADEAVSTIIDFYSNYQSLRYVGNQIILRVRQLPDAAHLEQLNDRFSMICKGGKIEPVEPAGVELRDTDELQLKRLTFPFGRHSFGDLHRLIHAVNEAVR